MFDFNCNDQMPCPKWERGLTGGPFLGWVKIYRSENRTLMSFRGRKVWGVAEEVIIIKLGRGKVSLSGGTSFLVLKGNPRGLEGGFP